MPLLGSRARGILRSIGGGGVGALALSCMVGTAVASPLDPSGVIRLSRSSHLRGATTESGNWFGYDQGALEKDTLFNAIGASWTVPTASQHSSGQEEDSATWLGIGGGCVNEGCSISDPTSLIQVGTEQDVEASGRATYSAWWELVPVPSVTIEGMKVSPGDRMHAEIAEVVPGSDLWSITLADLTTGARFSQQVPYPSSHASAEWIEETPLSLGTGSLGITALPALSETPFSEATVNGAPVHLDRSQKIDLSAGSQLIGVPSEPDQTGNGFGACAWATTCPVPGS